MMPRRIEDLPYFSEIAPHLKIEKYGRDGTHKPRRRMEILPTASPALIRKLLVQKISCCACAQDIHPFRARKAPTERVQIPRHLYVAVACPLDVNVGCSRGNLASDAYLSLEAAYEKWKKEEAK